jgi:phage shock protein E
MVRVRLLGITVALVGFVFGGKAAAAEYTSDPLPSVRQAVAGGAAILVDVREKDEWDRGHLRDARLLPLSLLQARVDPDQLARYLPRGTVVYCHCEAGRRTRPAADLLGRYGYDVRPLRQGYRDLLSAGFVPAR